MSKGIKRQEIGGNTHKLPKLASDIESKSRRSSRSSTSLFSRFLTAGAIIGTIASASIFNLGKARAEEKKPSLIAQAQGVNPASSAIGSVNPSRETKGSENSKEKLPKVSLADMQKLANDTCREYDCISSPKENAFQQSGVTKIKFPGGMMSIIVSIGKRPNGLSEANDILIMVNGKAASELIPLKSISEPYKQKTGKKLERVFTVVANTEAFSSELGKHVLLHILPRETDKLTRVVPRLTIAVTYKGNPEVYTESDLVAMR